MSSPFALLVLNSRYPDIPAPHRFKVYDRPIRGRSGIRRRRSIAISGCPGYVELFPGSGVRMGDSQRSRGHTLTILDSGVLNMNTKVLWRQRSKESRDAVLGELRNLVWGWAAPDQTEETLEDAETLALLVRIIEGVDSNAVDAEQYDAGLESVAQTCEAVGVGGRAWTEEQEIAANALFAAAKEIRALKLDENASDGTARYSEGAAE